jgi:hypothetical protein
MPLIRVSPAVGVTSPRIIRSVVVFPEPFGPRNPVTAPGSTENVSPSTAWTAPNRLLSSRTVMRPVWSSCTSSLDPF